MISVIMSVYREKYDWVSQSVNSILNQTYRDLELIIIIDNPDLQSDVKELLHDIAERDKRVKIYYNSENIGLAKSLNVAILHASGEYIARMDADDISFPTRLEKELSELNRVHADMISCLRIDIDADGKELCRMRPKPEDPSHYLRYSNCIVHPSVLMNAEVVRTLEGYRDFSVSQDYDLWLRMLTSGYKIALLNEYLIYYRINDKGLSAQKSIQQFYTSEYQKKLYRQRRKNGTDNFTTEQYQKYIYRKVSRINSENFLKAKVTFDNAISSNKIKLIVKLVQALLTVPDSTLRRIKTIICLKLF